MATYNGTDFIMSIAGSPNKRIADTRDITLNTATALIDVSTRDSLGWKENIGGQRSFGGSVSGIIDYVEGANEQGIKSLVTLEIARTAIDVVFGTGVTGHQSYTGKVFLTDVELSNPYEGAAEWTANFEGTGALLPATTA